MCILGWHRQLPRNRMQFGGAAVPVSWSVEQVELVLLSRTRNMLIWWVVVLSCLYFLRREEFRRGDVRNSFGHTRSKVTTWIGFCTRCMKLFVLCCFVSVHIFFHRHSHQNRDTFGPSGWKHCLVACRVHVRACQRYVVRTAATLRITASAGVDGRKR